MYTIYNLITAIEAENEVEIHKILMERDEEGRPYLDLNQEFSINGENFTFLTWMISERDSILLPTFRSLLNLLDIYLNLLDIYGKKIINVNYINSKGISALSYALDAVLENQDVRAIQISLLLLEKPEINVSMLDIDKIIEGFSQARSFNHTYYIPYFKFLNHLLIQCPDYKINKMILGHDTILGFLLIYLKIVKPSNMVPWTNIITKLRQQGAKTAEELGPVCPPWFFHNRPLQQLQWSKFSGKNIDIPHFIDTQEIRWLKIDNTNDIEKLKNIIVISDFSLSILDNKEFQKLQNIIKGLINQQFELYLWQENLPVRIQNTDELEGRLKLIGLTDKGTIIQYLLQNGFAQASDQITVIDYIAFFKFNRLQDSDQYTIFNNKNIVIDLKMISKLHFPPDEIVKLIDEKPVYITNVDEDSPDEKKLLKKLLKKFPGTPAYFHRNKEARTEAFKKSFTKGDTNNTYLNFSDKPTSIKQRKIFRSLGEQPDPWPIYYRILSFDQIKFYQGAPLNRCIRFIKSEPIDIQILDNVEILVLERFEKKYLQDKIWQLNMEKGVDENLYFGSLEFSVKAGQWTSLPSLLPTETILLICFETDDAVSLKIGYSEYTGFHYIKAAIPAEGQLRYFIKTPKVRPKLLDYPYIKKIERFYQRFEGDNLKDLDTNLSQKDFFEKIRQQNTGACRFRAAALFEQIVNDPEIKKADPNFRCFYINNDIHAYINLYFNGNFLRLDPSGSFCELIDKPNQDPFFNELESLSDSNVPSHSTLRGIKKKQVTLQDKTGAKRKIYLDERLMLWKETIVEPTDLALYTKELLDSMQGKNACIRLPDRKSVDYYGLYLLDIAIKSGYLIFYYDNKSEIPVYLMSHLAIDENNQGIKVPGSQYNIYRALQERPDQKIAIILNFDNFTTQEMVQRNSLYEKNGNRKLDGILLGDNVSFIGLCSSLSDKSEDSISTRFQRWETLRVSQELLQAAVQPIVAIDLSLSSSMTSIELYNSLNWEQSFLGTWRLNKNASITFQEGELTGECNKETTAVCLKNPPLSDRKFWWFINKLNLYKKYELFFKTIQVPECFTLYQCNGYQLEPLLKNTTWKQLTAGSHIPEDVWLLNNSTIPLFFKIYYVHNDLYRERIGILERHAGKALSFYVTTDFPLDIWASLLNWATKKGQGVKLTFYLAQGVKLPEALTKLVQFSVVSYTCNNHQQLNKNRVILSNDIDYTMWSLTRDKEYTIHKIIDISAVNASQILYQIGANPDKKILRLDKFYMNISPILQDIRNGKTIILKGKFSQELVDQLSSLFLSDYYVWIPGSHKVKPTGRLLLLVEQPTQEKLFQSIPQHYIETVHVTLDMKYQLLKLLYPEKISTFMEISKDIYELCNFSQLLTLIKQEDPQTSWNELRHLKELPPPQLSQQDQNLEDLSSEADSIFKHQRVSQVLSALEQQFALSIVSHTGIAGKSTFIQKELSSLGNVKVYQEHEFDAWVFDEEPGRYKIYVQDEANFQEHSFFEGIYHPTRALFKDFDSGYNVVLLEVAEENLKQLEEISKHFGRFPLPVLFKHQSQIKILGYHGDRLTLTSLDYEIFKTLTFSKVPTVATSKIITAEMYEEIKNKNAHKILYVELDNWHKVIFLMNPENYSPERQVPKFIFNNPNVLVFPPLPAAYIFQSILLPLLNHCSFLSAVDKETVGRVFLKVYLELFTWYAQSKRILITPRELQMMTLFFIAHHQRQYVSKHFACYVSYMISRTLVSQEKQVQWKQWFFTTFDLNEEALLSAYSFLPDHYRHQFNTEYVHTPSRELPMLYGHILMSIRNSRVNLPHEHKKGGINGLIFDGVSAAGKTLMVSELLRLSGLREVRYHEHIDNLDHLGTQVFVHLDPSVPVDLLKEHLLIASKYGHLIWMDEIDAYPGLEPLINNLILGENPTGEEPIAPTFFIIGTVNGNHLPGRWSTPAMTRRVLTVKVEEHPENEIFTILMTKGLDENTACFMSQQLFYARKYASQNGFHPKPNIRKVIDIYLENQLKEQPSVLTDFFKRKISQTNLTISPNPTDPSSLISPSRGREAESREFNS